MRILSTDPEHPGFFAVGQMAVGVIALGQLALGVVAIGQVSRGIFCLGQGAVGVFAVGQGSVGLFHATGMLGLAGQRGYGIVLHTLPRLVTEPLPPHPDPTPLADIIDGKVASGWVPARIDANGLIEPEEGPAKLDASNVYTQLREAHAQGFDRAFVKLVGAVVPDASDYRSARSHRTLNAEEAIPYKSKRETYLAYGVPPRGAPGGRASFMGIVFRTLVWIIALTIVSIVSLVPLAEAILEM